nr:MAG TPA: Integrase [Caudoviricetes sp.]
MATVNYYLDTRRQKKDGTYPIKLNIRHNKQFMISTEFTATPETWDGKEYNKQEKNYKPKNIAIRNIKNKVETLILILEESGKLKLTTDKKLKEQIEEAINNRQSAEKNFLYYFDQFVDLKKNVGTKSLYQTTRNKISVFDPECTFESIDYKWLKSFEEWMAKSMKINAYAIHFRNIRAVFNYAIDEEITPLYPFRKFRIKKEETRKRSLTIEQLVMLRDYPCEEYQKKYRDMFMLMFYLIGINAADLFNAKPNSLNHERIEYKRAKTGKLYSIKVEPEAMKIIKQYKGNNYLLSICDDYQNYKDFLHRMGNSLKQIGETERKGLGGKKIRKPLFPDLSSYWSRHTWATIAAELDIPKETISAALGHNIGSAVTSIYINFDYKKVDEANRKVIDYVNKFNEKK